jgi:hypothetical protein
MGRILGVTTSMNKLLTSYTNRMLHFTRYRSRQITYINTVAVCATGVRSPAKEHIFLLAITNQLCTPSSLRSMCNVLSHGIKRQRCEAKHIHLLPRLSPCGAILQPPPPPMP